MNSNVLRRFFSAVARHKLYVASEIIASGRELPELDAGIDDSPFALPLWKPAQWDGVSIGFDKDYGSLALRYPALFEEMASHYRWYEFVIPGLAAIFGNYSRDPLQTVLMALDEIDDLSKAAIDHGFLPFGTDSTGTCDLVCFDLRDSRLGASGPVAVVGHERLLSRSKKVVKAYLSDSFESFLELGILRLSSN